MSPPGVSGAEHEATPYEEAVDNYVGAVTSRDRAKPTSTTKSQQGASASRLSGGWDDDDYDVLADGVVVGRIMKAAASPVGSPWLWPLAFGHHEDRTPTHGYEATREAAMAAFAKCGATEGLVRKASTLPLPPVWLWSARSTFSGIF
jgi:hypothetical protein